MSDKPGRKPDYNVAAMCKSSELKGTVGAAWLNADGTISITLNAFVKLEQTGDLLITLFKRENGVFKHKAGTQSKYTGPDYTPDDSDSPPF